MQVCKIVDTRCERSSLFVRAHVCMFLPSTSAIWLHASPVLHAVRSECGHVSYHAAAFTCKRFQESRAPHQNCTLVTCYIVHLLLTQRRRWRSDTILELSFGYVDVYPLDIMHLLLTAASPLAKCNIDTLGRWSRFDAATCSDAAGIKALKLLASMLLTSSRCCC